MDDRLRWVGIALAVLALAGMAVHYGATEADHYPYTPTTDLAADYDAHVGERTYFWAGVTAVEDDGLRVENYAVDLRVRADPTGVDPGDTVQVAGTVRPDHTVDAARVVVSPRPNRRYMFAVSGLAALLVGGAVLRYWRIDLRTLTVRPRERDSAEPAARTETDGGDSA